MKDASIAINGSRLLARLDELSKISAPGRGVTRLAYSREDVEARQLIGTWMKDAGLAIGTDPVTNLIGTRPGKAPCRKVIATGSHIDSVVNAGPLDGAYGVVAAIEVAAALGSHELDHGLVVVGFSNEEGARGSAGTFGSLAIAGQITPEQLEYIDADGISLSQRIKSAGGNPQLLRNAVWEEGALGGFIELHVEQGPVLSSGDTQIGVVEAITAQGQFEVEIIGVANHAGTTPMAARSDAVVAAAHAILAIENLTRMSGDPSSTVRVATAGRIVSEPGVRNVISSKTTVSIDIRDVEIDKIRIAVKRLELILGDIAGKTNTKISLRQIQLLEGTRCASELVEAIDYASTYLRKTSLHMVSGAGHDSQSIARIGPVGMIFVPSVKGLSHSPEESTMPDDLIGGAQVLLQAILRLDTSLSREHNP